MSAQGSPSLAAMYQEALLAHHRSPHNKREMTDVTGFAEHKNPVCGDHIRVMVRVEAARIVDVSFLGQSCSVGTASASLMTDAVMSLTVTEALAIVDDVEAMLAGQPAERLPEMLSPLRSVVPFAARHGCARLPWVALKEAVGRPL
ncbi:MAG: SUF system NifU family Fe-S cluster assembly protein [Gemmatimonadaceae bacterium]|nr:SUF system NifU family Fe-S cluster assembly protein [Gemmatimonadaceae bacterium]